MDDSMTEFTSFRHVIELWERREALAAELPEVTASQVSKWWQRDNIPSEWWTRILSTERANSAGVTSDLLARLAAREPAEVAR